MPTPTRIPTWAHLHPYTLNLLWYDTDRHGPLHGRYLVLVLALSTYY